MADFFSATPGETVARSYRRGLFDGGAPQYEVYALRFAISRTMGMLTRYWRGGPDYKPSDPPPVSAFYYFLIKGPGVNILFDTGFMAEILKVRPVAEEYEDHASMLGRMGLRTQDIDSVIISHVHYDHANGIRMFPHATHYIHEACYDWAVRIAPRYALLRKVFLSVPEDVEWLARLNSMGRIAFVKGECGDDPAELLPGIRLLRVDGHFRGLLAAVVNTARGPVILASDSVPSYGNLEIDWPPGIIHTDLTDALDALERCREILGSGGLLVPGHDIAIMERFPGVAPAAVRIA